jgi:hypothetical protein
MTELLGQKVNDIAESFIGDVTEGLINSPNTPPDNYNSQGSRINQRFRYISAHDASGGRGELFVVKADGKIQRAARTTFSSSFSNSR